MSLFALDDPAVVNTADILITATQRQPPTGPAVHPAAPSLFIIPVDAWYSTGLQLNQPLQSVCLHIIDL